ncbi:putative phosphoribomutase [Teratosphaeria destructans]|uniref:Phosphoribomutase n=1 Tax=Teratosphaeria destructans TaxID=418781 RepID=A0A9W7SS97_9PEZI|nr:putative phosphoribomutase [Teratosphaeria destructans]
MSAPSEFAITLNIYHQPDLHSSSPFRLLNSYSAFTHVRTWIVMQPEPIRALAQAWLDKDKDAETRKEIEDLLTAQNDIELEKRLRYKISFGTAGLRSAMKAGSAHMNSVTVLQASQGLADYITARNASQSHGVPSIVIGYDARHNSSKFARLTAGIFLAKGFRVLWYEQLVHTPMVPFAVSLYKAAAGVMITASHNPKQDNGYKVYWSNGAQIIPPHDSGIATAIDRVQDILTWDDTAVQISSEVKHIFTEATQAYFECVKRCVKPPDSSHSLKFTYTPMHGVGLPFMERVTELLGIDGMTVVEAQAKPDPNFPTVGFPNPEEKGALSLAFATASECASKIVIANDPDADRFAAAEEIEPGKWHQFTGNQMGVLLGSHIFETYEGNRSKLAMLASTVSSRMLAAIAKQEGFHFKETLTGFKWLANIALELKSQGSDPVYAYEEAIGYMFTDILPDKDGVAAAAVFLLALQRWKAQGLTPWRKLQQLYTTYGYFEDANTYIKSPSQEVTECLMAKIRNVDGDGRLPLTVGKRKVQRYRDLRYGVDLTYADGPEPSQAHASQSPDLPVDFSNNMITCWLEDVVFTVRTSGTEPKIKLYIEGTASTSEAAKAKANDVLYDLVKEWFKPQIINGELIDLKPVGWTE